VNETGKNIFLIVSALFPIVNPLGGSPFFLALTQNYSHGERRALSRRVAANSFFLLIGSYFIGSMILGFFGISIPVVQVAGGLVVISNGWVMCTPFHKICTPIHTSRDEDKRIITLIAVAPSARASRSANP
jgi:small neutral amino acid transporter SnatA (MarC family)